MLLVLTAGFALRVTRLGFQELRGDEAFGYFFSLRPFANIVSATVDLLEPHPVASYAVQKIWLAWAGDSEFALRFGGVCFGVLAVALLYRLGRRLHLATPTILLAALLLCTGPYAIWHSQDARMYSMSLALTMASMWLALEALASNRRAHWLAYLLVSLLALHTHYFSAFIILAQNLFVLTWAWFASARRRLALRWLGVQALLLLLYLPWLVAAREILVNYRGNGDSPGLVDMLLRSLSVFAAGETVPDLQRPWLALLALLLLGIGIAGLALPSAPARTNTLHPRWTLWFLLLYLSLPLGATWLSALSRPIFDERYLVSAVPPFLLLVSQGLVSGPALGHRAWRLKPAAGRLVQLAILSLWLAASLLSLWRLYDDPAHSKTRGWRELATTLDRLASGLPDHQVRLVQNFPDPTLWYYYRGPIPHIVLPPVAHDASGAAAEVQTLADAGVRRAILVVQPAAWWDEGTIAGDALSLHFVPVAEVQSGGWPLQVYSRLQSMGLPTDVRFANGLSLAGVAVEPDGEGPAVKPGGVIVVHLHWAGDQGSLSGSEKAFLHLVGDSDQPLAQVDRPLSADDLQSSSTSYGILLPADLAPGTYRLLVGLYNPALEGAPRLLTVHGTDSVELATIPVVSTALE